MAHSIVMPYEAPNLNDLNRSQRAASFQRGKNSAKRSSNKRRVFDVYQAVKGQWATRVWAHALEQNVPKGAFPNGAHVHIHIVEADRRRDPDNITSGATKLILDGLVAAGILPTDGWDGVLSLRHSWEIGKPSVTVILTGPEESVS